MAVHKVPNSLCPHPLSAKSRLRTIRQTLLSNPLATASSSKPAGC
jgi:hypothetical protein